MDRGGCRRRRDGRSRLGSDADGVVVGRMVVVVVVNKGPVHLEGDFADKSFVVGAQRDCEGVGSGRAVVFAMAMRNLLGGREGGGLLSCLGQRHEKYVLLYKPFLNCLVYELIILYRGFNAIGGTRNNDNIEVMM